MGAFENQIRENETFESLMELYKGQIHEVRAVEKKLLAADERIRDLLQACQQLT